MRSDQPVSDLVFWDHTKMAICKCAPGAGSRGNNAKLLLKKAGKVDGLVFSDQELTKLMKDRDEWRLSACSIVIDNK